MYRDSYVVKVGVYLQSITPLLNYYTCGAGQCSLMHLVSCKIKEITLHTYSNIHGVAAVHA